MLVFSCINFSQAPSAPPQNVSLDSITSSSISLSWEPPLDDQRNGIIVQYTIRIVLVDEGSYIFVNSTIPSVTVTSLRPYTTYDCFVAAETSAGRGPFSTSLIIVTEEAGEGMITIVYLTARLHCFLTDS